MPFPGERPIAEFCPHHTVQVSVKINFREELTQNALGFQRSQGVNNSLGVLYKLLAEGSISPRRASVLAYISSLLLRTLPAIDYDNKHFGYDDDEAEGSNEEREEDNQEAADGETVRRSRRKSGCATRPTRK